MTFSAPSFLLIGSEGDLLLADLIKSHDYVIIAKKPVIVYDVLEGTVL